MRDKISHVEKRLRQIAQKATDVASHVWGRVETPLKALGTIGRAVAAIEFLKHVLL